MELCWLHAAVAAVHKPSVAEPGSQRAVLRLHQTAKGSSESCVRSLLQVVHAFSIGVPVNFQRDHVFGTFAFHLGLGISLHASEARDFQESVLGCINGERGTG